MIIQLGSGLAGGWDAIDNIFKPVSGVTDQFDSSFFPIPQRPAPIVSEITQAGNFSAQPYPVGPDAPSIWESGNWAAKDWIASPYAPQYAPTTVTAESKELESLISASFVGGEKEPNLLDNIVSGMNWFAVQSRKIRTLADDIMGPWTPRDTVKGTPIAGSKDGRDVQHLNDFSKMGADVINVFKTGASAILDQAKGLFNLGFPQDTKQPAFGLTHDIKLSKGLSTGLIIAGIAIVVLILFTRKK